MDSTKEIPKCVSKPAADWIFTCTVDTFSKYPVKVALLNVCRLSYLNNCHSNVQILFSLNKWTSSRAAIV